MESEINRVDQYINDILILVGRLLGEDEESFSAETCEVMSRWKPVFWKSINDTPQAERPTEG